MCTLIRNMMKWFNVSEAELKAQQTIPTPMDESLDWRYYCYVKDRPIDKWPVPTHILWASAPRCIL